MSDQPSLFELPGTITATMIEIAAAAMYAQYTPEGQDTSVRDALWSQAPEPSKKAHREKARLALEAVRDLHT